MQGCSVAVWGLCVCCDETSAIGGSQIHRVCALCKLACVHSRMESTSQLGFVCITWAGAAAAAVSGLCMTLDLAGSGVQDVIHSKELLLHPAEQQQQQQASGWPAILLLSAVVDRPGYVCDPEAVQPIHLSETSLAAGLITA